MSQQRSDTEILDWLDSTFSEILVDTSQSGPQHIVSIDATKDLRTALSELMEKEQR